MKPTFVFLFLAITSLSGQMAWAQTTTAEAAASATHSIASSHFEAAYNMASLSVGGVKLSAAAKQVMHDQILQGFSQDADFQELEQEFPGVTVAMVDTFVPVAIRQTEETMPALIERLARLYAEKMTAEEIAVATEWYSSPAYSRINAIMESNMDLSQIIRKSIADSDSQVSDKDLEAMNQNSAAQSVSAMELADRSVLMQFSATSAFAKIEALKPKSLMIEAEWTNEDNPDHDAELENLTIRVLEEFTGMDLSE
ncbi:DUF2059 domain-containing protein [Parasphingorhabdus sp.]|uniref:DUF2059 domain-containing protein n=1 Tax=Parasphingorhabdus sp. TaxID=2709688 RepID=UPI003A92E76B